MQTGASYRRVARIIKVILPVTALAMMSVMFLAAKAPVSDLTLPYLDDSQGGDAPAGMRGARTTGISDTGSIIETTADIVTLDGDFANLWGFDADITDRGGIASRVSSDQARATRDTSRIWLNGNAHLQTSQGIEVQSQAMEADFDRNQLRSPGQIDATAPFGTISAGKMDMQMADGSQNSRIVFSGGVEMLYQPQAAREQQK